MSKQAVADIRRSSPLVHSAVVAWIGAILAIVPLYATQYVFAGLMFEKAVLFYGMTTLLILAYIVLVYLDRRYLPKFNLVGWGFLALTIGWVVSTLVSVQPYPSLWGIFNRMEGLVSWIYYFAIFVVMVGTLRQSEDWWKVVKLAIIGIGLVVLYGLGQFIQLKALAMSADPLRVESTLGNPVFLGGYLSSALPLILVWVLGQLAPKWRRWGWIFWGLTCFTLIFTLSRGAWIASLIAVLITITLYFYHYHFVWLKKTLIFTAVGAALFAILTVSWIFSPKNSWFHEVGRVAIFRSESMTYRERSWSAGIKAFAQRPLAGWGLENFHVAFDRNYKPLDQNASFTESHVDRAHNEYIGVAVAGGLLAFIPYLWMLLYAIYRGWRDVKRQANSNDYLLNLGMLGALIGYAIFVFTAFNLITNILFFILALAWMNRSEVDARPTSSRWLKPVLGLLAIVPLIAAYFTVIAPVWAVRLADIGTLELQNGNYRQATDMFKQSLAKKSFMSNVIRSQMSVLASSGGALDINDKALTEFQQYTGSILPDIFKTEPYTSYTSMITGMFYGNLANKFPGYAQIADGIFSKTVDMSPHKGESWLRWGEMYAVLGDWPKAKPKFDQALIEDPHNYTIMFTAGLWHIRFGDIAVGEGLVKQAIAAGHAAGFADVQHIADAFEQAGQHDKAAVLYQQIIANPQNEQETVYAIVELADVYRRAGRWQDARATADELLKYEVAPADFKQLVSDIENRVAPKPPANVPSAR